MEIKVGGIYKPLGYEENWYTKIIKISEHEVHITYYRRSDQLSDVFSDHEIFYAECKKRFINEHILIKACNSPLWRAINDTTS